MPVVGDYTTADIQGRYVPNFLYTCTKKHVLRGWAGCNPGVQVEKGPPCPRHLTLFFPPFHPKPIHRHQIKLNILSHTYKMADSATHWKFTVTHYRKPEHTHEAFMNWIIQEHLPGAIPIFKKHGILEYSLVSCFFPWITNLVAKRGSLISIVCLI